MGSKEMIFLDYCQNTKEYRLMDPYTKRVTKSRSVTFQEDCYTNETGLQKPISLNESDDILTQNSSSDNDSTISEESYSSIKDSSDHDPTYVPSTDCTIVSNYSINLRPLRGLNYLLSKLL